MTLPPDDLKDELIGGHFRIERELGHGGMATVYLCTDTTSGEQAAVKILHPELSSVVTTERFFREIEFASELSHPRIPRVLESGKVGDLPYYAMEFVEGESLRDRLKRVRQLPVYDAVWIAHEIAKPMSFAHQRGIVHRDIKPENILLRGKDVYVLDFGVARAIVGAGGERLTRTGITVGTPAYMSPEQVTADRDLDYRSDIFSFGCVVYEMLAGSPPWRGNTPQVLMASRFTTQPRELRSLREDVPEYIDRAIAKAMARAPESRWQSVDEFIAALMPPEKTDDAAAPKENELLNKLKASFHEQYDVESEMTGGGMARLFLATDKALGRRVVIKILPPDLVSPMMLARFKRESEVTARLQHPHILPVISAGVKDGLVNYIMPFIDGESLRNLLEREKRIPVNDGCRLLREVTDALAYAHRQGIIHRDIKPENILIQDGHAILADFGIAAALSGGSETGEGPARLTGTGMSLGTIGYMAPEQALGEKNVDARADIYAVGVVGYEMFAGDPPFTGATDQAIMIAHLTREAPNVESVRPDTPLPVAAAIRKAMEKDPANRFATAAEFRDAIEGIVPAPRILPKESAPASKRKAWMIPAAAAAAVAIAAISYFLLSSRSGAPPNSVTIAIAPFDVLSSNLSLWREGMVDMLARNLDGTGPLRTISPAVSIKAFHNDVDHKRAVTELAKNTKAQYGIYGALVPTAGDSVRLTAHLVTAATEKSWDYEVVDSTAEAAADKFTLALLKQLGGRHTLGAARKSSIGTSSVEATRAFLRGEQYYRRTSWDSAETEYRKAISSDPRFALALRRAAYVISWQTSAADTIETALRLRAGAANHGLSPRDSLLISADSLMASLSTMRVDSIDWKQARRLFAAVNEAARLYPDDPEVWYTVGEARFHHGFGSPVNSTDAEALTAFQNSIALDSGFAPAYVHAVELAFTLRGADLGTRYTRAFLRLRPTDKEAEGIRIIDEVARLGGGAASDEVLDRSSSDALMAAWFPIRRWPDSSATALRLLRAIGRKPSSSATHAADSARLWNFLPLELAYRGRMSEAYLAMGNRPWRLFVEMALIGGVPADSATAVTSRWVKEGIPAAYFALAWFAKAGRADELRVLASRADSASNVGDAIARKSSRYRASAARAYLSLARGDTADALKRFGSLADTVCIACYMDRVTHARLLVSRGRFEEADKLLEQRLNTLITPAEIWIAGLRGETLERLHKPKEATEQYERVVAAWSGGDEAVQPYVRVASEKLRQLLRSGK
jgi:serine/threonine-protein kinase